MCSRARLGAVAVIFSTLFALRAEAYPFYIDVQGGPAEFTGTSGALFQSGLGNASNYGGSAALGFFYSPFELRDLFDIQIGAEGWWMECSTTSMPFYSDTEPYLEIRAQLWMLYFSGGVAPWVWRRTQNTFGLDNYSLASGSMSYLFEAGILYPLTPRFSMGVTAVIQYFDTNGVLDPAPAVSLNFAMRFHFSLFGIGGDSPHEAGGSLEYTGWRYIGK